VPQRDRCRANEGLLSCATLFVLLPVFVLVFLAKRPVLPPDSFLLNQISHKQLVQQFGLSVEEGEKVLAHRIKVGGFTSTDQLLQVKGVEAAKLRPLLARLPVRQAETVFWRYLVGVGLLLIAVVFAPPIFRARVGGDPYLLPLALLLCGFGVALLYSHKDPLHDRLAFEHHLRGIGLGLLAMYLAARLAPFARQRIKNYRYLWVFASAAILGALFWFGQGPQGVRLALFGIQPVEIIKILLIFFLASYLADRAPLIADTTPARTAPNGARAVPGRMLPRFSDLGPVIVMYGFALTLFFVVRDLGPGLLLFTTFLTVLYLTTGRVGFVWTGGALLLAGAWFGYSRHLGVFATRVDMWLSPFVNAHPNGMQLAQGYWAMASGGWEGSGLGLGMTATLPRGGSDLAFASWTEETGILGAWMALVIIVVLVWRGLRIALRANSDFDRALAYGLTALFGLQAALIVGGVTGIVPLSGLSLPFLSYGNSALIADFILLGLLRGISEPPRGGVGRPAPRGEVVVATRRFAVTYALVLLGAVGLWRLGTLLLVRADEIATRPVVTPDADRVTRPHENPRLLAVAAEIERGSIYDANGRILATSRPAEIEKAVPNRGERRRILAEKRRYYPFGPACAHLVGYVDPAVGGPSGLEKGYHAELRGYTRAAELLPDYRRRNLPGYRPRRGADLRLTIDAALQRDIQTLLWRFVSALKDKRTNRPKDRAAFVLLDPRTGDVLTAVTLPTFDPNALTSEQVEEFLAAPDAALEARFVNRAVSGVYPPGSTMKVATAAVALDTLPNAQTFAVVCNQIDPEIRWQAGGVTYVRRNTRDDRGDPDFGRLTLAPAFRVSSNIYFANLAVEIGANAFRNALTEKMKFRYVPEQKAFDADLPDIGYGQGRMLASPLEMARLTAAVAAKGTLRKPRFVTSITPPDDPGKKRMLEPEIAGQAMKPQTALRLSEMMRSVVLRGTARGVFDSIEVSVAGKTGTAQNEQGDREPHSWFVGFAPYEIGSGPPPRYAFACVAENGGYGKKVAAVICRDVLKKLPR
jgi:cell division protein FtsI/penicillin-binding protein 2/cell division protein FtsW (lipid II flippase)